MAEKMFGGTIYFDVDTNADEANKELDNAARDRKSKIDVDITTKKNELVKVIKQLEDIDKKQNELDKKKRKTAQDRNILTQLTVERRKLETAQRMLTNEISDYEKQMVEAQKQAAIEAQETANAKKIGTKEVTKSLEQQTNTTKKAVKAQEKLNEEIQKTVKLTKAKDDFGKTIPQTYTAVDGKYQITKEDGMWDMYKVINDYKTEYITTYLNLEEIRNDSILIAEQEAVAQAKIAAQSSDTAAKVVQAEKKQKAAIEETVTAQEKLNDATEKNVISSWTGDALKHFDLLNLKARTLKKELKDIKSSILEAWDNEKNGWGSIYNDDVGASTDLIYKDGSSAYIMNSVVHMLDNTGKSIEKELSSFSKTAINKLLSNIVYARESGDVWDIDTQFGDLTPYLKDSGTFMLDESYLNYSQHYRQLVSVLHEEQAAFRVESKLSDEEKLKRQQEILEYEHLINNPKLLEQYTNKEIELLDNVKMKRQELLSLRETKQEQTDYNLEGDIKHREYLLEYYKKEKALIQDLIGLKSEYDALPLPSVDKMDLDKDQFGSKGIRISELSVDSAQENIDFQVSQISKLKEKLFESMQKVQTLIGDLTQKYGKESFNNIFGETVSSIGTLNTSTADKMYNALIAKEQEYTKQQEAEAQKRVKIGKEMQKVNAYYNSISEQISNTVEGSKLYGEVLGKVSSGSLDASNAIEQLNAALEKNNLLLKNQPSPTLLNSEFLKGVNLKSLTEGIQLPKEAQTKLHNQIVDLATILEGATNPKINEKDKSELWKSFDSQLNNIVKTITDSGTYLVENPIDKKPFVDFLKYLQQSPIKYTDEYKKEFDDKTWQSIVNEFGKSRNRIITKNADAKTIDQQWAELVNMFPDVIKAVDENGNSIINEKDKLVRVLDAVRNAREIKKSTKNINVPLRSGDEDIFYEKLMEISSQITKNIDNARQAEQKNTQSSEYDKSVIPVDVEQILEKDINSALKQLSIARNNETVLFNLKGVVDGSDLINQAQNMVSRIAQQSNLTLESFSVKDNIIYTKMVNDELKVTVDQMYKLRDATEETGAAMLELASTKFSQNVKALNTSGFDLEKATKDADAAYQKIVNRLKGQPYEGLTALEDLKKQIKDEASYNAFNRQLKLSTKEVEALSAAASNGMNAFESMNKRMESAPKIIEHMRNQIKSFGDIVDTNELTRLTDLAEKNSQNYIEYKKQGSEKAYDANIGYVNAVKQYSDELKLVRDKKAQITIQIRNEKAITQIDAEMKNASIDCDRLDSQLSRLGGNLPGVEQAKASLAEARAAITEFNNATTLAEKQTAKDKYKSAIGTYSANYKKAQEEQRVIDIKVKNDSSIDDLNKKMQNVSVSINTMELQLTSLGNVNSANKAADAIDRMREAAEKFNKATSLNDKNTYYNAYNNAKSDYDKYYKKAQEEKKIIDAMVKDDVSIDDLNKKMETASTKADIMKSKLSRLGDVKGIDKAASAIDKARAAIEKFNQVKSLTDKQSAFKSFENAEKEFNTYYKAAQEAQKAQKEINDAWKNQFQNNYKYNNGKTVQDQSTLNSMGDWYKQEEAKAQSFNANIKSTYNDLISTLKQINTLSSKINDLSLKDGGSGLYKQSIESLQSQKSNLVEEMIDITAKINKSLNVQLNENGIAKFFDVAKERAALTSAEIEKFDALLLQSDRIGYDFASKVTSKVQPTIEKLASLQKMINNGSINNSDFVKGIAMMSDEMSSRMENFKKYQDGASAMDVISFSDSISKDIDSIHKLTQAEAQYFANYKKVAKDVDNVSNFKNLDSSNTKLEERKKSLTEFAQSFAQNKANIIDFKQTAEGITKLDFSYFDEGTNSVRKYTAAIGTLSDDIRLLETTVGPKTVKQNADQQLSKMSAMLETLKLSNFDVNTKTAHSSITELIGLMDKLRAAMRDGKPEEIERLTREAKMATAQVQKLYNESIKLQSALNDGSAKRLEKFIPDNNISTYDQLNRAVQNYAASLNGVTLKVGKFNEKQNKLDYTLTHGNGQVEHYTASINQLGKIITSESQGVTKLKSGWQDFSSILSRSAKQMTMIYAGYNIYTQAIHFIRQGVTYIKEIDSAMVELKKVTDETNASYAQFLKTASQDATKIGATTSDYVNAAANFARLGYSMEEAGDMGKSALVYKNVGDGLDSVEQATNSIISTMKAFGVQSNDTMSIVDKFNEVGNNFAITSVGIGDALERSASALYEGGNTLDESIGLITAANSVVQDPDVVGTALKTVALRMRGVKTELEDAGLETEGMAQTTSELQKKLLALTKGKVDIQLNSDEFKSTYEMLKEMSTVWDDMTDIDRAAALELIAGKRQANIVASLISNFQTAEDAAKSAADSTGSALTENEKVLDGIEGKTKLLTNSLQNMWNNSLNAEGVKMFLDIANAIAKAVDNIGLFRTAVMAIVGIMAARNNSFGKFFSFKNAPEAAKAATRAAGANYDGGFSFTKGLKAGISEAFSQASRNLDGWGKIFNFKEIGAGFKNIGKEMKIAFTTASGTGIGDFFKQIKGGSGSGLKGFASQIKQATSQLSGFKKVSAALKAVSNSTAGAQAKQAAATKAVGAAAIGAEVAVTALNMALTMGLSMIITKVITGLMDLVHAQKNAAESAKEVAQESREAYETEKNNQQTLSDSIAKYKELRSQKLQTAEVRGEIASVQQEIVSLVGEQVSGLNLVNGNLDTQLGKLEEIAAKQAEITNNKAKQSYNDANKAVNKAIGEDSFLLFDGYASVSDRDKEAEKFFQDLGYLNVASGGVFGNKTFVSDTFDKSGKELKTAVDKAEYLKSMIDEMEANYDDYGNSEVYAGLVEQYNAYTELIKARQQAAQSLLESTTSDFYYNNKELEKQSVYSTESLQKYRNKMVEELSNNTEIKTALKNGDITMPEIYSYVDNFIASTEDFTAYYGAWKKQFQNKLTNDQKEFAKNIMTGGKESGKYIKSWFDSLSEEDQKLVYDIAVEYDDEAATWNLQNWKDQLESMQETIEFSVDIDLESETSSIEGLNTAIQESMSATGLSETAMKNLQGRYSELAAQGYDLSAMFEETANGIHLNRKAVSELEQAYVTQNQEKFTGSLDGLKNKYDELTEKINNCSDANEKSSLIAERAGIAQQISEVATLAAQYEGLTSAYKTWQDAESAGSERDMYENVLKGFDTVDDEISRGWVDDGTIEFLELLSGRTDLATASTKELKKVYKGLDKEINSAGYSVRDFFTVDDEGNSTNTGVYNFLETVEALETSTAKNSAGKMFKDIKGIKDLVKRDKNGNIVSFDFGVVGGDEAIAEALGISEELVQIMLRAADDAGFVVNLDGTWSQFAELENEARSANNTLKELGKTDVEFDFNTSNISDLKSQLTTAQGILDQFKDEDGNIDLEADGAEEAMKIVSTLQAKLDSLTSEKYGIGLTVEDEKFQEPLAKLQEYGHNVMTLNQLEINPKANAEEIDKINAQLDETASYFANLDEETKVQIGFEADDGVEEVKKKIEAGEVKIPTTLDIQAKMGKSIEDLKKIALLNSGILSEDQEKAIKAELVADIDVEAGEVNTDKVVKDAEKETDEALNGGGKGSKKKKSWFQNLKDEYKDNKSIKEARKNIEELRKEHEKLAESSGLTPELKKKFEELKKAQRGLYNEQLSQVDGLGKKDKKAVIDVAVDYENGQASLKDLTSQINSIENKEVRVQVIAELAQSGAFDKLLADLDEGDKEVVIKALTEGEGDVDQLNKAIDGIEDKDAQTEVRALVNDALDNVDLLDGKLVDISSKEYVAHAFMEVFGVEDLDELREKLKGLDSKTIQAIAEVFGAVDVEKLKEAMGNLDDETVQAIAEAIGTGDVEGLKKTIDGMEDNEVQAIAEAFGYDDVDSLKSAIDGMDSATVQAIAQVFGITDATTLKNTVNSLDGLTVQAIAQFLKDSSEPDSYQPPQDLKGLVTFLKESGLVDGYNPPNFTRSVTYTISTILSSAARAALNAMGINVANGTAHIGGTAHVKGTAWAGGTALKQGDWRTKKTETALTGELGQELVGKTAR